MPVGYLDYQKPPYKRKEMLHPEASLFLTKYKPV